MISPGEEDLKKELRAQIVGLMYGDRHIPTENLRRSLRTLEEAAAEMHRRIMEVKLGACLREVNEVLASIIDGGSAQDLRGRWESAKGHIEEMVRRKESGL